MHEDELNINLYNQIDKKLDTKLAAKVDTIVDLGRPYTKGTHKSRHKGAL